MKTIVSEEFCFSIHFVVFAFSDTLQLYNNNIKMYYNLVMEFECLADI